MLQINAWMMQIGPLVVAPFQFLSPHPVSAQITPYVANPMSIRLAPTVHIKALVISFNSVS
jgi:hypothetical protein